MNKILILVVAFAFGIAGQARAVATNDDLASDNDKMKQQIFEGRFTAGAESRYQHEMLDIYSGQLQKWSHLSLIFSAISFLASLIAIGVPMERFVKWKYLAPPTPAVLAVFLYLVGAAGLVFSIRSDDSKAAARYIDHAVLQRRWEVLGSEWARLEHSFSSLNPEALNASITALMVQQAAIESAEPSDVDQAVWDKAWVMEAQVRELPVPPKPNADKQASL